MDKIGIIFNHMDGHHMMDWWGIPFMGFWMIGVWLVFVVIAFLVYEDAEKRGMPGLLWFVLVILPWIGLLFLIIYLIIREDKTQQFSLQKSAKSILDERCARGEITREEYQRMKKDIKEWHTVEFRQREEHVAGTLKKKME